MELTITIDDTKIRKDWSTIIEVCEELLTSKSAIQLKELNQLYQLLLKESTDAQFVDRMRREIDMYCDYIEYSAESEKDQIDAELRVVLKKCLDLFTQRLTDLSKELELSWGDYVSDNISIIQDELFSSL